MKFCFDGVCILLICGLHGALVVLILALPKNMNGTLGPMIVGRSETTPSPRMWCLYESGQRGHVAMPSLRGNNAGN